jgi:uncharacterized protein YcnI
MNIRYSLAVAAVAAFSAATAVDAFAHARISPSISVAKESELYSLVVPTEKEGAKTTKVVLTLPAGFSIDSFVAAPGWQRVAQQTGSGEEAVIQKVTWTASGGGGTPTGEDSLFQFLGLPGATKTYTFTVQQTYSDGSVVDWSGAESSDSPAPTVEAKSSLGGGSSSLLGVIAIALAAVAVVIGAVALVAGGGKRQLA